MCVLKRFDDVLAPTKEQVLETYEKVKHLEVYEGFLERASGYSFYNISKYDFKKLTADSAHIEENFREYINGFSENVRQRFTERIQFFTVFREDVATSL